MMALDLDIDVLPPEQVNEAQQLALRCVRGIRSVVCGEDPGQRPFVPSGQTNQAGSEAPKFGIGSDRVLRLAFPGVQEFGAGDEPAEVLIAQPALDQKRKAALLSGLYLSTDERARACFLRRHMEARRAEHAVGIGHRYGRLI